MKTSRRYSALLFVDIAGFSSIAEKSDPEDVKKILQTVFRKSCSLVKNFGGHLYQIVGDQIVFSFGFPASLENQDEMAVSASLAILNSTKEISSEAGVPIVFHIGLHSGPLLCGTIEIDGSRSLSIVGDAINVASRLQQICPRNQILVSENIVKAVSYQFNFRFKAEIKFKGKKRPVKVYRVISVKARRMSRRGVKWAQVPFVGRESEILKAYKFLKKNRNEHSILLVDGDPGVGKTRFTEELLRDHFSKSEIYKTRTLPYGADSFYSVRLFIENLLPGLSFHADRKKGFKDLESYLKSEGIYYHKLAADTFLDFFSGKAKIEAERPKTRFLLKILADLTKNKINAVAEKRTILVFEDLHWARKPLLDMIDTFLRELTPDKVFFILITRSYKTEEMLKGYIDKFQRTANLHKLELLPLKREQSDYMISFILNIENIPPLLKSRIIEYSQGNPLFLEEITKMLVEKGIVWKEQNIWKGKMTKDFDVPRSIGEIILSRFDMLSEETKRFLEAASASGYSFSTKLVNAISGDLGAKEFKEAEKRNFITKTGEGECIFNHILIRDSIYSSLTNEEKITLHEKIFNFLKKNISSDVSTTHLLAHHAEASELWSEAFRYYLFAAQYDEKRFSFHQSNEYLDKCSQIIEKNHFRPDSRLLYEYLTSSGRIYGLGGNYQKSLSFFNRAGPLAETPEKKIDHILEMSDQLMRISRYAEAGKHLDRALLLARKIQKSSVRRKKLFHIYMNKADVHYFLGDIKSSSANLNETRKYITDKNSSEYLAFRGKSADILNDIGEPLKALKIRLEIEKKASKMKLLTLLSTNYNNLGVIYDNLGNPQRALLSYEKANDIDRKAGYVLGEAISSYNISTYYSEFGKNHEAGKWLEVYHRLNLKIENRLGEGYYNLGLAEIRYNKNEVLSSIASLTAALKIFRELNVKNMQFYVLQLILLRSAEIKNRKLVQFHEKEFERVYRRIEKDDSKETGLFYRIIKCYIFNLLDEPIKFKLYKKRLEKELEFKENLPEEFTFLNILVTIFNSPCSIRKKIMSKSKIFLANYEKNFESVDDKNTFRKRRIISELYSQIV